MDDRQFTEKMKIIVEAIAQAGYDPYSQLSGYLLTGKDMYITRKNGARELITQLDSEQIHGYVQAMARE